MSKLPERATESRGREVTTEIMKEIPRLLRADAAGKRGANAILWNAAADELERLEKENQRLAKIVDGIEGLAAKHHVHIYLTARDEYCVSIDDWTRYKPTLAEAVEDAVNDSKRTSAAFDAAKGE